MKPLPEFEAWNVTETAGSSISGEDSKGGRNLGAGQASLLPSSKRGREIDCLKHALNPELEAAKNFTERLVCPLTCG